MVLLLRPERTDLDLPDFTEVAPLDFDLDLPLVDFPDFFEYWEVHDLERADLFLELEAFYNRRSFLVKLA